MSKRPLNLTIESGVVEFADQIMELRKFGTYVALIEQLIREEWERRNGPLTMRESPPSSSTGQGVAEQTVRVADAHARAATTAPRPPKTPVKYKIARRSKKKPSPGPAEPKHS